MAVLSDEALWAQRNHERADLVRYARARLVRQLGHRGLAEEKIASAHSALDPNALTLGFARRFTEYKRPTLLLHDQARLARLLSDPARPVQLIVAGKAHPHDQQGKEFVRDWAEFVQLPDVRARAVFLEDYDITLAQELVQGVDVWISTPRRPWEACGTSGMKVLVNGGLNLSELDGWWAEAYSAQVGWALGDGREHDEPEWDAVEARQLYALLEDEIVPAFYARDSAGLPRDWVARIRASMATLAPQFSSSRMVCDYVERSYLPAAAAYAERCANGGEMARTLRSWESDLRLQWDCIQLRPLEAERKGEGWLLSAEVYVGDLDPDMIAVELYADLSETQPPVRVPMQREALLAGDTRGYRYRAQVPAERPAQDYTVRVVPHHRQANVPIELPLILWQR
jgi:starch phosphorylase